MGCLILFSDLLCDRKAHASPVKPSPLNRPNREKTKQNTKINLPMAEMSTWLPQLEHELHELELSFDSVAASVDETLS